MLKLVNNLDTILTHYPDQNAESLAKTFIKEMQKNNQGKLYEKHLSAYLEEVCFGLAIQELYEELKLLKYTRSDCFQEARKVALEPMKIYKTYNFKDSSPKTWGKIQIKSKVKQTILLSRDFGRYGTWSALKYLSEKKLREALQAKSGIKAKKEIESYVLVVNSYKEIYPSSQSKKIKGRLPEPNQAQWEEIQKYYNFLCSEYNKKPSTEGCARLEAIINFQVIKEKYLACYSAAKNYIYMVEDTVENIDIVADEFIPVNHQEEEIETEKQQQIASICLDEFAKLPLESQKLMQLHYGLGISQTEMQEIFNFKQPKISRKIKQSEQKLLKALVKWSQENLGITVNEGIIKEKNQPFKDWLKDNFQQQFEGVLEENLWEQQKSKIPMLRLYYGEQLKLETVAERLNVSSQRITQEIEIVKQNLEIFLREWVKEKMDISLSNSRNKRIVSFVEEWLNNAPYEMWNVSSQRLKVRS
ncbi:MAG: sigma-70 family RNA polymerase sigma factor [Okeania sp. SIO3I5]|uniref:hypothetical protein n=1 Tax=Okeania sp. SIO3I5 TaxID=2607805 RepID=UPI0013B867B3|nr:hypothetical protein [Okeania sp. SIO3I5]NEQ40415.1 sigma-70 family RNA polymerase sigma factor [Okeania sp. SIO3I5]